MPIIVLNDKNVREILERAIKKKSKAYRYYIRENLMNQSEFIYHEWKALTELATLLGVKYKSVTEKDNGTRSEYLCLEIYRKNNGINAIIVPLTIEFTKKQIAITTKILEGTDNRESWYRVVKVA